MPADDTDNNKAFWSLWIKRFGMLGAIGLLVTILAFLIALKLRLLSKFGIYLGAVGLFVLGAGVLLLFNTGLLIIGNLLILAGETTLDDVNTLMRMRHNPLIFRLGFHRRI